jgi:hypothetical protein
MDRSDFDGAWRAFAQADAQVKPPVRLRPAVMAAWDGAHQTRAERSLSRPFVVGSPALPFVAILAAVVIVVAAAVAVREPAPIPVADLLQLTADPPFENEPLEIVRLRLTRTSLEALGIGLVDPEAFSLVDVDVLVGGDRLPLAIRHIRPVVDGDSR